MLWEGVKVRDADVRDLRRRHACNEELPLRALAGVKQDAKLVQRRNSALWLRCRVGT